MKEESPKKTTYLVWAEKDVIQEHSHIESAYEHGFVATRLGKGKFQQTRSVRIDLQKFIISSENRRILKKTEPLTLQTVALPIKASNYDWHIHKIGSDFYSKKFGDGTFSANKIKSILTDESASSFTTLFTYKLNTLKNVQNTKTEISPIGYCIALETPNIVHYSYPFYKLEETSNGETTEKDHIETVPKDMGMGMMVRAVLYAKEAGKKYIYLGSLQRPGDVYKLQFEGIEWFNGKEWTNNIEEAKNILKSKQEALVQELSAQK